VRSTPSMAEMNCITASQIRYMLGNTFGGRGRSIGGEKLLHYSINTPW
jgi:hypothetical protein